MRSAMLLAAVIAATAVAAACTTKTDATDDGADGGDDGSVVLPPENAATPPGPAGSGLATGLPCDVQAVLENRCIACHDGGLAVPMLTYDDLIKKSSVDPAQTIAQLAVERMKSTTSPMPPPPAVKPDIDEIAAFENWVKAGAPKSPLACTSPPPEGLEGGVDAGPITLVCTSGTKWTLGDQASPLMHPGAACNACHQIKGGPNLRVAGTVFPTLHEPDDCNGSPAATGLTVIITDSKNQTFNLPVNAAGNFSTEAKNIKPPFRAKVTAGAKVRAMAGTVTSGDCNSCHTATGAKSAPGRIQAP